MPIPFIIYLENKQTSKFEYRRNVVSAVANKSGGYRVTFAGGRSYNYGADRVRMFPYRRSRERVHIYVNGWLNQAYDTVDDYGKYLIFRKGANRSYPYQDDASIEICEVKGSVVRERSIIAYFRQLLQSSGEVSFDVGEGQNPNQLSTDILLSALDGLDVFETRSVLSDYLVGRPPAERTSRRPVIFPFGCNESQKRAVETALQNSISIVEGPPGTGKTQTILNIIANLVIDNKTVAVVSNNNSAVFNVGEKLDKYGYGMLVAALGSRRNREAFFETVEREGTPQPLRGGSIGVQSAEQVIRELDKVLTDGFEMRNRLAVLKTELADAKLEFEHMRREQPMDEVVRVGLDQKFYRKLTSARVLELMEWATRLEQQKRLSIWNKISLVYKYGLLDGKVFTTQADELSLYLNHRFYELYIAELKVEIERLDRWLMDNDEANNLKRLVARSKDVLDGELIRLRRGLLHGQFSVDNYRRRFNDFVKQYPVVLSSTLSLHTSIPKGYLFDYLIIDEASQVDIIKSSVCFSCARNVVVVGDSMQLTHIVDAQSQAAAESLEDAYAISSAYDYVKQNILSSLKSLYGERLQSVLLREHYRCHPTIIGFCNKKYYDNQLVVMTDGDNHPFKIIETTITGGRDNYNQRQIDETDYYIRENYAGGFHKVGVVAPYRNHADRLQEQLPEGAEADTIHKYQGREKDVIIFNTVRGEINEFIDNPNLINVAVSRAVEEFIVVKPEAMELSHGTNLGDLVRYMIYADSSGDTVIESNIASVFDLLYKEYQKAFEDFMDRHKGIGGSAAEVIVHQLLGEQILTHPRYSSIGMVREYRLRDLVRNIGQFDDEVAQYVRRDSRLDFLLYNKLDKSSVLAIEVDGVSFHSSEVQQERDRKKDFVLESIGLPLLRLSTDGHNEEKRIVEALQKAMGINSDSFL